MPFKDATSGRDHFLMSLRVSRRVGRTLEKLSEKIGMSKTAVIVLAIRELAEKEGIPSGDRDEK